MIFLLRSKPAFHGISAGATRACAIVISRGGFYGADGAGGGGRTCGDPALRVLFGFIGVTPEIIVAEEKPGQRPDQRQGYGRLRCAPPADLIAGLTGRSPRWGRDQRYLGSAAAVGRRDFAAGLS